MRILWFTNTPSCYSLENRGYNGGGWISSLEKLLTTSTNYELGISFLMENKSFKTKRNNVTYYPINLPKETIHKKILSLIRYNNNELTLIKQMQNIIEDFKPNIIHVFGTEEAFGLISTYTNIPTIIQIQGLLNPCFNAFLPPFISWCQYIYQLNPYILLKTIKLKKHWEHNTKREERILKNNKYYLGRTKWDYRIIKLYNPKAKYFYCSEVLRDIFYQDEISKTPSKLTIITTISEPFYKGYDVILKTAKLLKTLYTDDFDWIVFGNINQQKIEKLTNINSKDVNIRIKGIANAETIKKELLNATCYVNTSYIDNSPNSICEAQIVGCPVITTNVGGISSIVKDTYTGYLVPSNDPYQLAYLIKQIHTNNDKARVIANRAKDEAKKRHNKEFILKDLLFAYKYILDN